MSTPPATTATVPVVERAQMRRGVDAARQARRRRRCPASPSPAASSRARRRPLAEALRAPTTATIGALQQLGAPEHGQDRRRVLDRGERARIEPARPSRRAARRARSSAASSRFGLGARDRGDGRARSPRRGEARQRLERGARPSRSGAAARKSVTGPIVSVRLSRSQSRRSCGSSSRAARASPQLLLKRDPALGAGEQAPDILVVPQDDQQGDTGDQPARVGRSATQRGEHRAPATAATSAASEE